MLRPRLEETAARLGLAERVCFTGFIPDETLQRFYQAADLVVLPSLALEGFGLITLEALASRDTGGGHAGGRSGRHPGALEPSWLVPAHGPAMFARTMMAALDQAAADPDVAARCRAHAATYGWERIAEAYEVLYRSLLGRHEGVDPLARLCGPGEPR